MSNRFRLCMATLVTVALSASVPAVAAASDTKTADSAALRTWAADTWRSFDAMVVPRTGLPADHIDGSLSRSSVSRYTSPTNIGMYIWATVAARDLGLITAGQARTRLAKTLGTLAHMARHPASGMFYNWYDPRTGAKITTWPEPPNNPVEPFLSSVDNGWLASALIMVANAEPRLHARAWALVTKMDFGFYYDPNGNPDANTGLIRGGFWDQKPAGCSVQGNYRGRGPDVYYTCHHYGSFNTEPRIASYIGIALGQIPADHYFGGWRTFPNTCDWSWPEMRPEGGWRDYVANGKTVHVFEGTYRYADKRFVPTWGGSMFEALMVPLVVPEEQWGTSSWARTHPLYVEAQQQYGLAEAKYGYWGFSPSSDPAGGYREYGVDALGMEPNGYTSDAARRTLVDYGWNDPACPRAPAPITDYDGGVVTPHASFLALDFDRIGSMANLRALRAGFPGLYGRGGFKDAVNVSTGQVADRYLSLDQGMVMAAIANELTGDRFQRYVATTLEPTLRPLMAMEVFNAGRVGP
ncbi:MAG: glucoamylase family protein [Candidatus Limnocylindria bacterium]